MRRRPSASPPAATRSTTTCSSPCPTPAAAGERLHVGYRDAQGRSTDRRIEPYRVVSVGRRWYLVAYDLDRTDWRTFRLDRMGAAVRTGHGVTLPDPPDAASFVHRAITTAPYPYQAQVLIHAPITDLERLIPPGVGMLEAVDDDVTRLTAGADNLDYLVIEVATIGFDFEIESPPELRDRVAEVARRLLASAARNRVRDLTTTTTTTARLPRPTPFPRASVRPSGLSAARPAPFPGGMSHTAQRCGSPIAATVAVNRAMAAGVRVPHQKRS